MASQQASQLRLVTYLKKEKLAKSARVIKAFEETDRIHFTNGAAGTYNDNPLGIGLSQTISAPHMHAMCLELMASHTPETEARVLDVGCGSGYLTAALARLVGDRGLVVGIDRFQALVDRSRGNIEASFGVPLSEIPTIKLALADGWKGFAEHAPYHTIHVGAAASAIPKPLLEQLVIGGRLIIPVGEDDQSLMVIDRLDETQWNQKIVCGVRYVPLVEGLADEP